MGYGSVTRVLSAMLGAVLSSSSALSADLGTAPSAAPRTVQAPSALAAFLRPADQPFFLRVGASAVLPASGITTSLAGNVVPGAGGSIAPVAALYLEGGYYLTHSIAVSLSGGYPPTLTTKGTGTLAPFGSLHRATVGIPVLAATYHLDAFGPIRPYAGLGVGYAITFRDVAQAVKNPSLKDQAALALVGGVDYDIDRHWGVFVDVKKIFLRQRFTGTASPRPGAPAFIPASASVRTDPLVISAGLSYRF